MTFESAAVRIKASQSGLLMASDWISPKAAALVLAGVALIGAFVYFGFVGSSRLQRLRKDSPARPQIDAAISISQERLRSNPQDIAALLELGTLHFEKGPDFYLDAVNELEDARRLGALDIRLFYCLGVMYQELGLYPFALEEYLKFLRNRPEDKEVRMLAAKIYYRQGAFALALEEYERLRFSYPKDAVILENLGLSQLGSKLTGRAAESFHQLEAAGGLPARRARFYLGRIAFEEGRTQEALDLVQKSLPADGEPDFGIPREEMFAAAAMACRKLNRMDEARDLWQKVLHLVPNDVKALAALRDLNRRAHRHGHRA